MENNFNKVIEDMLKNNNKSIEDIKREFNDAIAKKNIELTEKEKMKNEEEKKNRELRNYVGSLAIEVQNAVLTGNYTINIAAKMMALSELNKKSTTDKKKFTSKEEVVDFINMVETNMKFCVDMKDKSYGDILDYIDKEFNKLAEKVGIKLGDGDKRKYNFNKEFDSLIKMILDI